jgi:signal transduction histidine kinase
MKIPASVAEMGREEFRAKIQAGIWTGYATTLLFGALAWYSAEHGLIPRSPFFTALVVAKLLTNTASWITLRARVFHLPFAALNIAADLLVMTGAVYLTGGPASPLLPIYFIEVAVMALLTNVGLTIATIGASCVLFAVMSGLVRAGVLTLHPTPFERLGALTTPYLITVITAFGLCTLAPGAYIALIVQKLREKEAALEDRARDLMEAARDKSQFMVNVTHELRTPIHGIMGLTDLLREGIYGPVTDRQRESLDGIDQSAKGLLELIDGLLLLARAEATRLDLTVGPVAVPEIVDRVAATGRQMRGRKDLTLDVSVAGDLPLLQTDRGKLAQILLNLLTNAIKFTPAGGRVAIEARRAGDGVEIAVRDTGIGIPRAELPRIFDAFHQVDGSTSRAYGGAGLGLALVRTLAERIQGTVEVESTEGAGSTFTVRLPAAIVAEVSGE